MGYWKRSDLKSRAKDVLHRCYGRVLGVSLIIMLISGGIGGGSRFTMQMLQPDSGSSTASQYSGVTNPYHGNFGNVSPALAGGIIAGVVIVMLLVMVVSAVLSFFVIQPLTVGGQRFFSHIFVEDADLGELGYAFKNSYLNVVKNVFLMNLYIALWSLLFVIPGIIKSYEYRMIPYLLGDHPEMSTKELFAASREMMRGQKWDTFVLDLSFIGWYLLGACTCGIAIIFWVYPYQFLTNAALYRELAGLDSGYNPQGGGYGQNPYAGYNNQGAGYSQNTTYNQDAGYNQDGNSGQNTTYGQNPQTPYGQDYYSQNDNPDNFGQ